MKANEAAQTPAVRKFSRHSTHSLIISSGSQQLSSSCRHSFGMCQWSWYSATVPSRIDRESSTTKTALSMIHLCSRCSDSDGQCSRTNFMSSSRGASRKPVSNGSTVPVSNDSSRSSGQSLGQNCLNLPNGGPVMGSDGDRTRIQGCGPAPLWRLDWVMKVSKTWSVSETSSGGNWGGDFSLEI